MNKYKKNLPKFIIIVILALAFLIYYGLSNKLTDNYNYLKEDKSKYLVYTKTKSIADSYYQYIPYVNLKGELGTLINNDIETYLTNFKKNNICITYESDLNGKILSLVIKIEDHSYVESASITYFKSYNINLGTKEVIDNDTILNYFEITNEEVQTKLNEKIEEQYKYLKSNNLIATNCNYSCFIKSSELNNNLDDAQFFIRDGQLIVFKPYTYISTSSDENTLFDFQITE